ncbi:MAG: LptF/LptG family permease [Victivallales bacterium]
MRILNIYVTRDFVITGLMAVIVMTFGLMGTHLIKVFQALTQGIPVEAAFLFLMYIVPTALSLTIPFSVLVATMLVFGRLSAHNEITAMRACGISILQIISPIIILTFALTCICVYLQMDLSPYYSNKAKDILKEAGIKKPTALLEPGKPMQYENYNIYIDDKNEKNEIKNVQVYILSKDMKEWEQDITALSGRIDVDEDKKVMKIILFNAIIKVKDSNDNQPRRTSAESMEFPIDYGHKFNEIKVGDKPQYITSSELFSRTILYKKRGMDVTRLEVELNQRIALAISPIAFLLLGMPLAIRTSRRETSVGLFISVLLAGAYFISIMILAALYTKPAIHPQLLIWIPNMFYQIGGAIFLFIIARR